MGQDVAWSRSTCESGGTVTGSFSQFAGSRRPLPRERAAALREAPKAAAAGVIPMLTDFGTPDRTRPHFNDFGRMPKT